MMIRRSPGRQMAPNWASSASPPCSWSTPKAAPPTNSSTRAATGGLIGLANLDLYISGLGGALRARSASGLWGPAAPLGPVAAALVPRCALLPAPTPRMRTRFARGSGLGPQPNVVGDTWWADGCGTHDRPTW